MISYQLIKRLLPMLAAWMILSACGSPTSGEETHSEETAACIQCQGTRAITCTACFGHSHHTCSDCEGLGTQLCASCSGTGEETCTWCSGQSRKSCQKCNGMGKISAYFPMEMENGYRYATYDGQTEYVWIWGSHYADFPCRRKNKMSRL